MRQQYRRRSLCCRVVCGVLLVLAFVSAETVATAQSPQGTASVDPVNPYQDWNHRLLGLLQWLEQYLGDGTSGGASVLARDSEAQFAVQQFITEFNAYGIAPDLARQQYLEAEADFLAALQFLNESGNSLDPQTSTQLAITFESAIEQCVARAGPAR